MNKRVLIAMSGGIDSTVSAILLREQGYDLVGCTFRTFDSIRESCLAKEKGCCSIESIMEAKHNAEQMGFEHHIVDYRDTFRRQVIRNFVDEYNRGRTPSSQIRLKEILEEQGRTNRWLAQKINKSENTVSRWCHNKVQPSITTLNQIAEILNVDVRELLKPTE